MRDNKVAPDLRHTQLLAVAASLTDVRRNLLRAAGIPSPFSGELRALLLEVAALDRRVILESTGRPPGLATTTGSAPASSAPSTAVPLLTKDQRPEHLDR